MEVREKIPINLCTAGWNLQLVSLIFLVDHVVDLFLYVVKLFQLCTVFYVTLMVPSILSHYFFFIFI